MRMLIYDVGEMTDTILDERRPGRLTILFAGVSLVIPAGRYD